MDCLANTGSSILTPSLVVVGFLVIGGILLLAANKQGRIFSRGIFITVGLAGMTLVSGPPAFAAGTDCNYLAGGNNGPSQVVNSGSGSPTTPTPPPTTPPAPVVPPLFTESFGGGLAGSIADTSNTEFDNSPGGPSNSYAAPSDATFVAGGINGTAGQIALPAGSGAFAFWGEPLAATPPIVYTTVYVKVPVLADAPEPLLTLKSGGLNGTHTARVALTSTFSTSHFQLQGLSDTVVGDGSLSLPADTWARLEWKVDIANNTQELSVYVGANINDTTPDDTVSGVIGTGAAPIDYIEFGPTSNPVAPDPFIVIYDEIEVRSDEFADPV